MNASALLLAFGLPALAGYSVLALCPEPLRRRERIALAYPTGSALVYLVLFPASMALPASWLRGVSIAALAALSAAGLYVGKAPSAREPCPRAEARIRPWDVVLLLVLGAEAIASLVLAAARPVMAYDGISLWAMKGRHLAALGLDGRLFARGYPLPSYPILLPVQESFIALAASGFDDRLVRLFPVLLWWCAMGFAILRLLGEGARVTPLLSCAALFLACPAVSRTISEVMADAPLAIYVATAALLLHGCARRASTSSLFLAGLFTSLAAVTKREGNAAALLLACMAAGIVLLRVRVPRDRWVGMAAFLAPVLLLSGTWQAFLRLHRVPGDFASIPSGPLDPRLVPAAFLRTLRYFLHAAFWDAGGREAWSLCVPALGLAIAARPRAFVQSGAWLFLILGLAMVAVFTVALAISPLHLEFEYVSALPRLLFQAMPVAFLALAATWSWPPRDGHPRSVSAEEAMPPSGILLTR